MAQVQRVAIWPASLMETVERRETPYRLLDHNANIIARAAWWLLQKMKALQIYHETIRTWTYEPHKQQALHEAMLTAADGDLRYIYEGKAVFIIGGQEFSELTNAPVFREEMMFRTGPFGFQDAYRGRQIFNIPIHVVPHMTGMAVIPKVLIERSSDEAPF